MIVYFEYICEVVALFSIVANLFINKQSKIANMTCKMYVTMLKLNMVAFID